MKRVEYENDDVLDDSLIVKESQDAIKELNEQLDGIGKEIYDEVMKRRKMKGEQSGNGGKGLGGIMHDGYYLVKLTCDENKNDLKRFLRDNGFKESYSNDNLDFLLIDIFEKTFKSSDKCPKVKITYDEMGFYGEVNYVPAYEIKRKRLFDDEGNLLYEGNTFCDKPYGLGTVYFKNGNKYQEGIFDVKGFTCGREYYPNGQIRFEGKYDVCSGYGPNYPVRGRVYDENGNLKFAGSFKIVRTGLGYPMIKNPNGYKIFQENHPKYKWLMWDEREMIERRKNKYKNMIKQISSRTNN